MTSNNSSIHTNYNYFGRTKIKVLSNNSLTESYYATNNKFDNNIDLHGVKKKSPNNFK